MDVWRANACTFRRGGALYAIAWVGGGLGAGLVRTLVKRLARRAKAQASCDRQLLRLLRTRLRLAVGSSEVRCTSLRSVRGALGVEVSGVRHFGVARKEVSS